MSNQGINRIGSLAWDDTNNKWVPVLTDANGKLLIASDTSVAATITSGRKVVTTAGTAEVLVATSTPCYRIDVTADTGNTEGPIAIGGSTVVAANGSQIGILIIPGNVPVTIYIDNLNKLYVDSQSNGDAICYNYYTR